MARMVRLLRALPELMVLIKGLAAATRSVFFTFCLLAIIIYIFALVFVHMERAGFLSASASISRSFRSVPAAAAFLLLRGALADYAGVIERMGDFSMAMAVMLFLFVMLAALTVMNMLV